MSLADIGITVADFTDNPLADWGETVSWENATKTVAPVTGAEDITYAAGSNVTVVFVKRAQRYEQGKEAVRRSGSARHSSPYPPEVLPRRKDPDRARRPAW